MAGVDFRTSAKKFGRCHKGTVAATGCAGWGLGQCGREVFCPWRPLEVVKPWQARTVAAAKIILGAKTLNPKSDADFGS